MRKFILFAAASIIGALTMQGAEAMWLRDVKISPDGKEIAFCYKGDIYKVATEGGEAIRLTSQPSYESNPVWSPDGRQIAFASDRNGGSDIFIMSSTGGSARRLTTHSANEYPQGFSPDGKYVLFSASIQDPAKSMTFPTRTLTELYRVPVTGGRYTQVMATPALNVNYLADGRSMVYEDVKGGENEWRKHHTSSVTRDIWLYDGKSGKHTNLTNRGGEDRQPVVSPDKKTVYFLSERDGKSMNVYSMPIANSSQVVAVTDFATHPVRFLSQASNGLLAYTYDGEIYTSRPGEKPRKVVVNVDLDEADPMRQLRVTSADEAEISPDGKQLAFVSRGELFVTSVEYPSTKQISHTPQGESDICWGKDSREIYYTSDREGNYNIYRATIRRADDPNFSNATIVNEELVIPVDGVDRTCPSLSPDGKKLAFVADRNKLMVMDLATKEVKQLTDEQTNAYRTKGFNANWSPDSRLIALEVTNKLQNPYTDIAIVDVESGKMHYVTRTGYFDENPHWALDGNALIFLSERYGMRAHASWGTQYDVMIAFLNQDAYDRYRLSEEDYALLKEVEKAAKKKEDKKPAADKEKGKKADKKKDQAKKEEPKAESKKQVEVDFDGIEERTVRLTPNSSEISDAMISKDGDKLYYLTKFEGKNNLWEKDLRKGDVTMASKLNSDARALRMDADGNLYLIGGSIKKYEPKGGKVKNINISAKMDLDPAKEREYMLRTVYNEERERFYHPDMHGVDWDAMYQAYAKFLPHINNNYDFAEMLSELLGELNVSHTGSSYYGAGAKEPTASLGAIYDLTYKGPGLKIAEVLPGGPLAKASGKIKAGDVITSINGVEIAADADPMQLLNGLSGKKTLLTAGKVEEVVIPTTLGAEQSMLYDRWVKRNEAYVDSISKGRLGYVHIKAMNDASFRTIYAKVLGQFKDREGVVIDTRWNGGGRMHEDIEVLFSGKKYLTQDVHGVESSEMPSRRWNKPSVMVVGEANYSNAHGTPWVYKNRGLGKIVGMPVPGTMTSVNWVRLQDSSLVFGIPVIGFRTAEGNYLENTQLEPDVKVACDPAEVVRGIDSQLDAAVITLLKDIDSK